MKKKHLIVLTGIDGSGKTTQAELLIKSLKEDGVDVSYVWSRWKPFFLRPLISRWKHKVTKDEAKSSNNAVKEKLEKQKLLSNPAFRWLWLTAFFIDYGLQIFIKIRIKLFKKKLVISDRIFYDSVIDQGINLGKKKDWLLDSLDSFWMKIFFPAPDLVIYVDCPEDVAFSRKPDDAPDIKYLVDRRKLYLKLAERYNWVKMDGTLPVKELAVQIRDKVSKRLSI